MRTNITTIHRFDDLSLWFFVRPVDMNFQRSPSINDPDHQDRVTNN